MAEHGFDIDLIMAPRRSEKRAWIVAATSSTLTLLLGIAILVMMPLRETEVFTVLVDRETGAAERIMQVAPTGISDERAIREALLVAYLSDRESYLPAGIQPRLESVLRRSAGPARSTLLALWSNDSTNADYPPRLYGDGAEVSVRVRTITFLEPDVAQVRYEKTLRQPHQKPVTRPFVATIGFDFAPRKERALERVWENPLGFTVETFHVAPETLE
ncbi:Type IV secretion system protein virB8 (plasmid) [Marinibacterium anthonyi]|nr:Type IV secretion system protein virB8 [Marinibacterium anthonyi]